MVDDECPRVLRLLGIDKLQPLGRDAVDNFQLVPLGSMVSLLTALSFSESPAPNVDLTKWGLAKVSLAKVLSCWDLPPTKST